MAEKLSLQKSEKHVPPHQTIVQSAVKVWNKLKIYMIEVK